MPKKNKNVTINFISSHSFENSALGQVVSWSLTIGKVIVFITFAIIMGLFIYRFSLDRKITYLQKSIDNNVDAINRYSDIENDIRLYQDKLSGLSYIHDNQHDNTQLLLALENRLPVETKLENINISNSNISMTGTVRDEFYFVALLNSLKKEDIFTDISVSEITSGGASDSEIDFSINIKTDLEQEDENE